MFFEEASGIVTVVMRLSADHNHFCAICRPLSYNLCRIFLRNLLRAHRSLFCLCATPHNGWLHEEITCGLDGGDCVAAIRWWRTGGGFAGMGGRRQDPSGGMPSGEEGAVVNRAVHPPLGTILVPINFPRNIGQDNQCVRPKYSGRERERDIRRENLMRFYVFFRTRIAILKLLITLL
ncbi:hypothetical protein KSP39_PZI023455 [Platanthera zijinensis]|uniref:Uncharacterized protein n=1 Tax=Platanthera zijinensis TaxID=2320716 RepID=A0AAP0FTN0_9ASPA